MKMNSKVILQIFLPTFFVFLFNYSNAQIKSKLSLEEIMKGEEFTGFSPTAVQWADDSKKIYFSWKPDSSLLRDYYSIEFEKGN